MSTAGEVSGAKRRDLFNKGEAYDRGDDDWFVDPSWCTEALELAERDFDGIPDPVWDPACGGETIPTALRAAGIACCSSDLVDRGQLVRHDFLGSDQPPIDVVAVVCNPPYNLAEAFVRKAISLAPYVAMLVQAKFPYSQRRHRLFSQHPPARLYFLSDRPSMPPGALLRDGLITAKGGKLDFMWLIWDRRSTGPTTAHWIRKPGR